MPDRTSGEKPPVPERGCRLAGVPRSGVAGVCKNLSRCVSLSNFECASSSPPVPECGRLPSSVASATVLSALSSGESARFHALCGGRCFSARLG